MTSKSAVQTQSRPEVEPWPPDDTEESIVGTNLHQTTIINLRWGINEAAHIYSSPGEPLPWTALDQTEVLGFRRPDGSHLRAHPDVFVYRQPIDLNRGSVSVGDDGPPLLIIEVLSASTQRSDVDIARGKGYSYAQAGVREYLALDPTGEFSPPHGRGWRLVERSYQLWEPDEAGRWRSSVIPIVIGVEGRAPEGSATVYTREGRRVLREGEVEAMVSRQTAEIEDLRRQLREARGHE